jgi:hypothetical protein
MSSRFPWLSRRSATLLLGFSGALYVTPAMSAPKKAAASAAAATPTETAQCKSLCEARDNVSCPKAPKEADCNAHCVTFATEAGSCREQFDAWLEDLSKATWTCDTNGYPIYNGSATGVAAAFWQCYANTVGGNTKAVPTPKVCGVSSNDSACDNCLSFSCAAQSEACGADAECKAVESCLDKCPNSNDQPAVVHSCVEKCQAKHSAGRANFEAFNQCAVKSCDQCGRGAVKGIWDQAAKPNPISYQAFTQCTLIAP